MLCHSVSMRTLLHPQCAETVRNLGVNMGYVMIHYVPPKWQDYFVALRGERTCRCQPTLRLSQTSLFLRVCSTRLLKTLWKKEKLLVMSNFSFSHSVFYPSRELSAIFIKLKIDDCKLFQFEKI